MNIPHSPQSVFVCRREWSILDAGGKSMKGKISYEALLTALIAVSGVVVISFFFIFLMRDGATGSHENPQIVLPSFNCTGPTAKHEGCQGLKMVTRSEWLSQPAREKIPHLMAPGKRILLTDTRTDECSTNNECIFQVRRIQLRDISDCNRSDISYNFLIGGDGRIFEGRGYFKQSSFENYLDANESERSFLLGLMGSFTAAKPSSEQVDTIRMFANQSVAWGNLMANYSLFCWEGLLGVVAAGGETSRHFVPCSLQQLERD